MPRPTLEEIFSEPDEFGLLDVKPEAPASSPRDKDGVEILHQVEAFMAKHGRMPDPNASDMDEMRIGTIWQSISEAPSSSLVAADIHGLLAQAKPVKEPSWRDDPSEDEIPDSLDDIFSDDELDVSEDLVALHHVTPAAERQLPDHRAEFIQCKDFDKFSALFDQVQQGLDSGQRTVKIVRKYDVIEPNEGDFFIRNGLLAYIAEKAEKTLRGGARDHRLRVIFSNGTESDPLMSSFRKSLNDDKTARAVQRSKFGPLDEEWEADKLELTGTIYVARSLSTDPAIVAQRDILHKVGVTSQDVRRRVADARNDPTFLLAPVEIIATYELKNLARYKVEDLLHRFFEVARPADLTVTDRFKKQIHPREWFYVLPEHVSQAVALIQKRELHLYRYDVGQQKIVRK